MSRTLKRPMFRKGGEVMEGIMTGIKPRKMFSTGELAEQIKNVRQKVNLIDAVSGAGASPLSDPLTQFLLTAGPDLVAGKAAGGTKLQEILGGIKPGLDRATAVQMKKDASRRKLAGTLLAKSSVNDARKAYNTYGKALYDTFEEFLPVFAKLQLERKPMSIEDRERQDQTNYIKGLQKVTDSRGDPVVTVDEGKLLYKAKQEALKNDVLKNRLDPRLPNVPKKAGIVADTETLNGKKVKVFRPKTTSTVKFEDDFFYFDTIRKQYLLYNKERNILIPYSGLKL